MQMQPYPSLALLNFHLKKENLFIQPKFHTMPNPSIKNEEQYEALLDKGYSKEKSARIANTPDSGKKGGKAKPYEEWTKIELYQQAKNVGIEGRSKMDKGELIHALRNN
jgi:hypothetical protein